MNNLVEKYQAPFSVVGDNPPQIVDAAGNSVAGLMWPVHAQTPDGESAAVTYLKELAGAICEVLNGRECGVIMDAADDLRQLSAEREHNANEALAMRAERDAARRELAHLEPLISKCAEAMGFIRLAAICLKLNGSQWSEEPGFTVPMNSALLKLCAERDAANALVDRLAGALDKITKLSDSEMRDGDGAREIAESALAEVAKALSPRTTENTKPQ